MNTLRVATAGLAAVLFCVAPCAVHGESPESAAGAAESAGTLEVVVALVGSDLALKPVPKQRFTIVPGSGAPPIAVSTSFGGQIDTQLPAGTYSIRSSAPAELDSRSFSWDVAFEIRAGLTTALELSNDNAKVEAASAPVTDEGAIYRQYSPGVFKILAENGQGSGFLVASEGLIVTNDHVVRDSKYLAVKCDARHKVQAVLVAGDPQADLAILRVHPDAVAGRPVLQLAQDGPGAPIVSVGDRVLAIGNPLGTDTILTTGIVSKVEDESIYSDVNINAGNSGGPLLSTRGQVIGVNTFGLGGSQGPGVSGIVRIYRAQSILENARKDLSGSGPPSSRLLPVEAEYRFSPDELKDQALATDRGFDEYHVEAGKIDVQLFTPASIASGIIRSEREAAKGRDKRKKHEPEQTKEAPFEPSERFYDWEKDSDNFLPVVRIRAMPEIKMKFGPALMGASRFKFKTDFARMELLRGGQPVEPIHPGRARNVVNVEGAMQDISYWGLYAYPPEAFSPGGNVTLRIWEEGKPEPSETVLAPELMTAIHADFAPYFAWLATSGSRPVEP